MFGEALEPGADAGEVILGGRWRHDGGPLVARSAKSSAPVGTLPLPVSPPRPCPPNEAKDTAKRSRPGKAFLLGVSAILGGKRLE
jgi:hypothetical protein